MKFKYKAKTKDGELQVGVVEAGSRDSAASILTTHDLYVLSIESAEQPPWLDFISKFFGRVRRKDMVIFTRQLSTLLEARLPLNTALKTLLKQTKHPRLKEAIIQTSEDVDSGLSFSQSLERQGDIFPSFYVEMIRAAEITGNLNEVTGFLADYTEKEAVLATKAASAMIYPGVIVGLFGGVVILMVTFVFPQLKPIFTEGGVDLPWYTAILLGTGEFLIAWWPVVLVALFVLGGFTANYLKTAEGQALLDEAKIRLPLLKKIFVPVIMTRFANSAALLIHGGIPVAQALEVISQMMGNVLYRDVVHEIAEDVRQGMLMSQSLEKREDFFPALVAQMIAVGETTGKIEQIFQRISTFYGREADNVINNIVDLIQPILMVVIGGMVGLLFAAILIPIYQLTSNIK
ncbi:MAG: hypothetical protein A2945_04110 [Candidatus Liptonbacteria bacterium RIFCSPLOWO2_01_FULL_52_25]|uniref:Type II secretion system protein GspF domain-containing protein n=1 Tax=Candidatus Liptonbacteria bacterium RIFCSPLOWO2_01_FULL_52_25 TaxID=1798650 RepID=A0A1G2CEB4_9BACT|nr:MAG: hypothetical protein A2945_04110 [Candidatus Liptonbacteria bacterium RIFCSPLOWO2_01_FULL_52_25]